MIIFLLLSILTLFSGLHHASAEQKDLVREQNFKNVGDPFFVTPFLKNGSIEIAQKMSKVPRIDNVDIESYSGFFTIDEQLNSNMFFWYFPAMSQRADAPVVLWLQGGPGVSSLFGLFTELGPFSATKDGLKLRKHHWALDNNLIFIDNPVGTGFSFTEKDEGYCKDQDCVGEDLYNSMQQFFTLFPKLRDNDFYVTGESYAGKYVPALGMTIHKKNPRSSSKINLKGLAIGNGLCDPINQIDHGSHLYQLGLLDKNQRDTFYEYQDKIVEAIKKEDWDTATSLSHDIFGTDTPISLLYNYTGFSNHYNILKVNDDSVEVEELFKNDNVRRSMHVGSLPFNDRNKVKSHFKSDYFTSMSPVISVLLSNYRMMIYNGQLDIIVAYPLTENFLQKLNFDSADKYKVAKRQIWRFRNEVAGYYKRAGNLTELLVRNAGHMVPTDQPEWALDMITKFIKNEFV